MSDKIAEPIDYILNTELSAVLSAGFAQLYRVKPDFPVTYLGKWLKNYSQTEKDKKINSQKVSQSFQLYDKKMEEESKEQQEKINKIKSQQNECEKLQNTFKSTIQQSSHLEDLLTNWLPQHLQQRYDLSGCYIGSFTHSHKNLQKNNFEPGAELDTENPKIVQYIGTSNSHKSTMLMKILPSENGVSYPIFNDPEPQPQDDNEEEKEKKQPKKTYIYVPDVTKNDKIHYFKYPKLGSYACFSLKLKSFLNQQAFDEGLVDYKTYQKNQEDNEAQFKQKLNEARQEYEECKKKFQELQINEQQPNQGAQQEKKKLQEEMNTASQKLNELENNPPVTPLPNFKTTDKMYLIGCDTLGQDKKIQSSILDNLDQKTNYFKDKFEEKQKKMLLDDILAFISQEPKLQNAENLYRQFQKNAISQSQEGVKEKFTREKQVQFEISVAKCKKLEGVFSETFVEKSMEVYFAYNIPKYQQIYQIALMLLGYPKEQINLPRKNALNFRKVKEQGFVEEFFNKLYSYQLRRQKSEAVDEQYKINKLLERLEKIDLEQIVKYNIFIWVLANHIKFLCWARIHEKEAKIESYEYSVKAKQEREQQMVKFEQELQKHIESQKQDVEEGKQFNEEQVKINYLSENPKPVPLQAQQLQQFLDIE